MWKKLFSGHTNEREKHKLVRIKMILYSKSNRLSHIKYLHFPVWNSVIKIMRSENSAPTLKQTPVLNELCAYFMYIFIVSCCCYSYTNTDPALIQKSQRANSRDRFWAATNFPSKNKDAKINIKQNCHYLRCRRPFSSPPLFVVAVATHRSIHSTTSISILVLRLGDLICRQNRLLISQQSPIIWSIPNTDYTVV